MKNHLLFLSLIFALSSCATTPQKELVSYMKDIRVQLQPIVDKKLAEKIKVPDIKAKIEESKNERHRSKALIRISKNGFIESVQIIQTSKYDFLNDVVQQSFAELKQVSAPPASCVKIDICEIRWDLVLVK